MGTTAEFVAALGGPQIAGLPLVYAASCAGQVVSPPCCVRRSSRDPEFRSTHVAPFALAGLEAAAGSVRFGGAANLNSATGFGR